VDCISKGGNLLLGVGPKEDGTLPQEEIDILNAFARWTSKHQEAIYGTRKGIPEGHFFGPTALSKNSRTLYLYIDHFPTAPICIKGLDSEIKNVRIVGSKVKPTIKKENATGTLYISIPENAADPIMTVVAIDFTEPLKLKTPSEETSLTQSFIDYLQQDKQWVDKHIPLVGNWQKGISTLHYAGPSMLSEDKTILYLLINGKPNGPLVVKGLKNPINRIWVVGNATKLHHQIVGKLYWTQVPGIVYIDVPERVLDPRGTVIAVLLDGPISLYTEEGQVIENN
jgi:alpha-L-fucosidase